MLEMLQTLILVSFIIWQVRYFPQVTQIHIFLVTPLISALGSWALLLELLLPSDADNSSNKPLVTGTDVAVYLIYLFY